MSIADGLLLHDLLDKIVERIESALESNKEEIVAQIDDLRAAIAQVGVDLGEAVARVQAKVEELGNPDPDLSADIANLQNVSAQLDALVAEQPPVEEPPVEEPPVEEPPVEPPLE